MTTFGIAARALSRQPLRAGLTVLGVVIGIAAVTTLVSVGQSAGRLIQGQFAALGTNVIVVIPGTGDRSGVRQGPLPSLTAEDAEAIAEECDGVLAVTPLVGAVAQVIYGRTNWNPKEIYGVGADYLLVRNWGVRAGGFFTQRDVNGAENVCVLGQTVTERLFQTRNPLVATVRIRNIPHRVIGVLERKGANMVGADQDDVVLLPYTSARKRLIGSGFKDVHAILV